MAQGKSTSFRLTQTAVPRTFEAIISMYIFCFFLVFLYCYQKNTVLYCNTMTVHFGTSMQLLSIVPQGADRGAAYQALITYFCLYSMFAHGDAFLSGIAPG